MNKIKVLLLSIHYPLAMKSYFERAFRRREDVELFTTGPFTGNWIPWKGGLHLPDKYAKPPDLPLPFNANVGRVSYDYVRALLPQEFKPDIVLTVDAGINWSSKPHEGLVATVATDPHVLSYAHQRTISDKFFNMQSFYSEPKDYYLPYAYDPETHYKLPEGEKDTDCVLIGMPYQDRYNWIERLRKHGVSVIFENAPVFDEYRELANRARIGLNWSSMKDLNARFFETPAFGLAPVMNRVPDAYLFLNEGVDYLGFDTIDEAVAQVLYLQKNPDEVERISHNAHHKIQGQTYDARVEALLKECGFA